MRRAGLILLLLVAAVAAAAPWLAPNAPDQRFDDLLFAPPTKIYMFGKNGVRPHFYPARLVSRLERRFEEDRSRPLPLRWFTAGRLVSADEGEGPLLLLGADAFGRDIFARLVYGARATLALAAIATAAAILIGALLSGSFVVEYVTAWPGLGRLMFEALRARDIYLVAGCAALGGLFLALGSIIADLLLAAADPRVRDGEAA